VLSHGILPKLLGSDQGVGSFAQVASRGANHLRRLRDRINASLYDVYGETPEASEIDQNWAPLVRGLLGKNYWVDFFTTNYDLVLEAVVDASGRDVGYGQGPGAVRQLDLEVWRKSLLDEAFRPYQDGLITKLHGSLNWERDRRGVVFGGPTFKSSHDHHVAIYPGFKGAPTAEPFSLMHDYFERALQSADLLIFIGFAFRDEYLNTLISRAPLSKKKKFVIDPADALGGPFQLQGGVSHHKGVFDLRSVEWLLAKV
jgi:hypothetical protein